jgi:hypothetical protein
MDIRFSVGKRRLHAHHEGARRLRFASAPESLCGSKVPLGVVCERNILILLD